MGLKFQKIIVYILMIGMQILNIKRENLIHKVDQNQPLPTKITKIAGHTSNPTCISKLPSTIR